MSDLKKFSDEIKIRYGFYPQPEFARIWYKEYLDKYSPQMSLEFYVDYLSLNDLPLIKWAEPN